MNIVLGVGCDRDTSLETLEQAIQQALLEANVSIGNVISLATIDKKNDETALLALVEKNGWLVHFYTAKQLAKVKVPNPSEIVLKYMGTPAVSEAAALLAANTDMTNIVLEKFKFCGEDSKNATVSIVRINNG